MGGGGASEEGMERQKRQKQEREKREKGERQEKQKSKDRYIDRERDCGGKRL